MFQRNDFTRAGHVLGLGPGGSESVGAAQRRRRNTTVAFERFLKHSLKKN